MDARESGGPPERKYALSKVQPGDYLLLSNDGQVIWRIATYMDGPSSGLDIPKDREFWAIWRWTERVSEGSYVDTGDWGRWEFCEGLHDTRTKAINAALSCPKCGGTGKIRRPTSGPRPPRDPTRPSA